MTGEYRVIIIIISIIIIIIIISVIITFIIISVIITIIIISVIITIIIIIIIIINIITIAIAPNIIFNGQVYVYMADKFVKPSKRNCSEVSTEKSLFFLGHRDRPLCAHDPFLICSLLGGMKLSVLGHCFQWDLK